MGGCGGKPADPAAARSPTARSATTTGHAAWWSPALEEDAELARAAEALAAAGQEHLFDGWVAGEADDDKKRLLKQAAVLDATYPGGLAKYVANARQLLKDSANGVNPLEGYVPSVPEGVALYRDGPDYDALTARGLREAPRCCFVIVAGGLGERLGFNGIKLSLPTDTISMTSYLELYIAYIREWTALGKAAATAAGDEGCTDMQPALALMTSDDTHEQTLALLEAKDYFGLDKAQVTLMKQGKVPALKNADAAFATAADDRYAILTKPHGHGDVHQLLYQHGLIQKWHGAGKRYVVFMQDTHALIVYKLLSAIGVSADRGFVMNSITVPRKPGEESGSICRLEKTSRDTEGDNGTKTAMTINVEYNQLNPLLQAALGHTDKADPETGYSPFPGNVNSFVLRLEDYAKVLTSTEGMVPEFVNPKYKDDTRTDFKSPTRLECMMQDIPKFFPAEAKVGFVKFEREMYCPVKNACAAGAAKQAKGQKASCAVDAEDLWYANGAALLRECGADVAAPAAEQEETWCGVRVPGGARVILSASACPTRELLAKKIGENVSVSARSVLVLNGGDITLRNATLDGTLVVHAVPGARVVLDGVTVTNDGWRKVPSEDTDGDAINIRGYKTDVDPAKATVLTFDTPGVHEVRDLKAQL